MYTQVVSLLKLSLCRYTTIGTRCWRLGHTTEEGVEIIAAKITTLGERVEDVFEICSTEGHPISDPDQLERLKLMIRDQLDAHIAETST